MELLRMLPLWAVIEMPMTAVLSFAVVTESLLRFLGWMPGFRLQHTFVFLGRIRGLCATHGGELL